MILSRVHLFGFQKISKAITFDSSIGIPLRFTVGFLTTSTSKLDPIWVHFDKLFRGQLWVVLRQLQCYKKATSFFPSMTAYQRKILLSWLSQLPKLTSFISKLYTITSKYPNSMPPQTFYRGNFGCNRGNFSATGKQLHFSLVGLRIRLVYGKN